MKMAFDSSTLILLAKVELLREVSEDIQIIIPERVKTESLSKEGSDALLIGTLIKEKKIEVKKAGNREAVNRIQKDFKIESGEAEALWLAITLDRPLAVDDWPAIKACKILGRSFTTALHFILKLASDGRLDRLMALEKLEKLSRFGRYSGRIMEDAIGRLKGGTL